MAGTTELSALASTALAVAGLGETAAVSGITTTAVTITVTAADPDTHAALLARACCCLRDRARLNARIVRAGSPRARDWIQVACGAPADDVPPEADVRAFLQDRYKIPGLVTDAAVASVRAYWNAADEL